MPEKNRKLHEIKTFAIDDIEVLINDSEILSNDSTIAPYQTTSKEDNRKLRIYFIYNEGIDAELIVENKKRAIEILGIYGFVREVDRTLDANPEWEESFKLNFEI